MPKQQNANQTAMNSLATKIKYEQAEQQFRLANYFVPYGFDPEPEDFKRIGQLLEQHGSASLTHVFGQATPNLQDKAAYCINEIVQRQSSMEALLAAGAEVNATDQELYEYAKAQVFNRTRAGGQARLAAVQ